MRRTHDREAMSPMQLRALGLSLHLSTARFCGCMPLTWGGVVVGALLLARGCSAAALGLSTAQGAFQGLSSSPAPEALPVWEGVGDGVAAFACVAGVLVTSGVPVTIEALWLAVRVACEAFTICASLVLALSGRPWMGAMRLTWLGGMLALDWYLLFVSVELLLLLELRSRVSPSTHQFLAGAQRVALASLQPGGWGFCCRRHLVVAMLLDSDIRELLRSAGVPVEHLHADVSTAAELDIVGERERGLLDVGLPLGADLEATILDAAILQEKAGDEKLRADHLLLALCGGGELEVEVGPGCGAPSGVSSVKCTLDIGLVREQLQAVQAKARAARPPEGVPGAVLLGCLPLEETVATWVALRVAAEVFSLVSLLIWGAGWGPATGFRTSGQLRLLDAFEGLMGPAMNILGLLAIRGHRAARNEVRRAAYILGARWDADLDVHFDAVRGEPEALSWFRLLKRGADWTGLLWLWSLVELLLDLPVFGLAFVERNACGSHAGGLAGIAAPGSAFPTALVHCGPWDVALMAALVAWLVVKAYVCWAILVLWHEYSHGWTTTDFQGLPHLTPFSLLPDPMAKVLAGLPRWAQAKLGVGEAMPLML